ncbi:hypothetical protein ACQEVS_29330 [Streptomyces sp. CA-181903]|uniref:hypothetical protein n=1 Tax=Streptomyces sp. CA-181903 TaxID=3240055 RepID=UPI003D8B8A78
MALPTGRDLFYGTRTLPDQQLTVQNTAGQLTPYTGTLLADGRTLVFTDVDLELPGSTTMWVAVSAGHDAPLGSTDLTFTVGGEPSPSTPIVVKPGFTVSPGATPATAQRGGPVVYPGVEVRNKGTHDIPPQSVTVSLPVGLRFGTAAAPDHQLTVWDPVADTSLVYPGVLSGDGRTLTFSDVDLTIPDAGSLSVLWVGVSASDDSPLGPTSAEFSIGGRTSPSTTINVV